MNEQYRGFNLYGGCEPISETLLGQVTEWKPTGCIAHKHREDSRSTSNILRIQVNSSTLPVLCPNKKTNKYESICL